MKIRSVLLMLLATVLLFNCSCQKQPGGPSDGEIIEQPEPQRMAYHCGKASRVGDDIYFISRVSFNKAQIFASEYGTENFEPFTPCFDAVCSHWDRSKCCIATEYLSSHTDKLAAFVHDGEPSLLLFNPVDICFSKPYLNIKTNLVYEDYITNIDALFDDPAAFMETLSSRPQRDNPFIYREHLYYTEIQNGVRTQYRIPITGGEPEKVFKEDNIIAKTIINDRFYGIRYEKDEENNDQMHYFRSDMNYENVETLPEMLEFFELIDKDNLRWRANVILDADANFIYVLHDTKVWKIPDSDINAEPILMWDPGEKIAFETSSMTQDGFRYQDGVIYTVINTAPYSRDLLNSEGFPTNVSWFESSILYSFDIRTGECKTLDISSQSYQIYEILYADDKYVYGESSYVHEDNRTIDGVTIRLTLDTMRYEVILPDRFFEYSAETAAE